MRRRRIALRWVALVGAAVLTACTWEHASAAPLAQAVGTGDYREISGSTTFVGGSVSVGMVTHCSSADESAVLSGDAKVTNCQITADGTLYRVACQTGTMVGGWTWDNGGSSAGGNIALQTYGVIGVAAGAAYDGTPYQAIWEVVAPDSGTMSDPCQDYLITDAWTLGT